MNKIAVYTAIFGGKDEIKEPEYIPVNCDLICFTDSNLESDTWQVRKVEPMNADPMRSAKIYKILPHRFLKEYEYSVWADGNMVLRGDVNELIDDYLGSVNIAVYDHMQTKIDKRGSVYEEARALIEMAERGKYKDDPEVIKKQIERYRAEGYRGENGLLSGMIIVRRHNEPDVVRAMEAWWNEIENYSKRDQLSFNYVAWKEDLKFEYIEGDSRDNPYFLWKPHKN